MILGHGGSNLSVKQASDLISGYAIGIDWTRRDRQSEAEKKGGPWDIAKNFDDAGVIGIVSPKSDTGLLECGLICLRINGELRQQGDVAQMVYSPSELIAYLSTLQILKAGDVIFTGTPSGVGAAMRGDKIRCDFDSLSPREVILV